VEQSSYVKEFGEGVDRMFIEMEAMGLPEPKYQEVAFMTKVTVKNRAETYEPINLSDTEQIIMNAITRNPKISKPKISKEYNISEATVKRTIAALKKRGLIKRVGSNKGRYWKIIKK